MASLKSFKPVNLVLEMNIHQTLFPKIIIKHNLSLESCQVWRTMHSEPDSEIINFQMEGSFQAALSGAF